MKNDDIVAQLIAGEAQRQAEGLELIPSENYVSQDVLNALGSVFTNKYSEGYPGKRYYGGQEFTDPLEQLAIDRAKQLFGADHANVQSHSGAPANEAVYSAWCQPGDTILAIDGLGAHRCPPARNASTAPTAKTAEPITADRHPCFKYLVGTSGLGGRLYAFSLPRIRKNA